MRHKDIYNGWYSVFEDGTIVSNERIVPVRGQEARIKRRSTMVPCVRSRYLYVVLAKKHRKYVSWSVHELVCTLFHGKKPGPKHEVNHKDGNKFNNRADNLEWGTRNHNQNHAANNGLKPVGIRSHLHKLTEAQVHEARALRGIEFQRSIGERFGVSQTCISKIQRGTKWKQLKTISA